MGGTAKHHAFVHCRESVSSCESSSEFDDSSTPSESISHHDSSSMSVQLSVLALDSVPASGPPFESSSSELSLPSDPSSDPYDLVQVVES